MFGSTWKKTIGALAVATGMAAAGQAAAEDTKVGFVYVGPISDHGWSYMHNVGREAIEKELGLTTTYVESVNEGPDAERVITKLAKDGHNLIFTTSFGFMNQTLKVAKRFPNVKFEHATGFRRSDNVSTYSARFYEGRYVVGHIVGKMTKTNTIGYIASFPIPEVIRGINATILGARKVNPDVQIKVVWVNTWVDPGKEGDAAKALIDQGADVIMQHTDSPSPLQVAQNRGVWAVGQASDMKTFAPKSQLTAIIDNWAPYYVARAKAAMDGSWKSEDTWGGFKSGMVQLADYNEAIPADVVKLAEEVRVGITDGSIHPFAGPIKNQAGEVIVPEGEVADDKTLLGMNFYVEGVQGELPQ
ncbi:BMP family ABC transporter substrate-binding protein [Aestuariispira insulae]|uniref:Nucleoside-binding protein n=1 Tax=Aestuariispira insulae TaxID=1461337 RepID=A0A3D9HWG8_9PROT|nr:BMP family ABC transporter substrate-binding protein [Aestuariispira insulae]RED53853.1 nucleoside-binding protein [Aestuariispira insulae]